MKIGKYDLHLHSMSAHFTAALYPVAIFFLILSYFYEKDSALFAYFYLMVLATVSAPVSYLTGIIEWKQKYKGAKVRIFDRKYRYGLVLCALGAICTLWYGYYPEIIEDNGGSRILFLSLNIATLPLVVYLGFLGGKLVFGSAH